MTLQARRSRGKLLVLTLLAFIAGGAAYAVGVLNRLGQRAEASVLRAADFTTNPPPPLNLVSVPAVALALVLIAGLAWGMHGLRRGVRILVVSGVAIIASQLLKPWLTRPQLFEIDAANTFPSGHMTVFVVLVGAMIWAVPERWRDLTAALGGALLAIVAWQILAYGWHRPSDVVGAVALGVAIFALTSTIVGATEGSAERPAWGIRLVGILGWIVGIAGVLLAGSAVLAAQDDWFLLAGELSSAGAAGVAVRSLRNT